MSSGVVNVAAMTLAVMAFILGRESELLMEDTLNAPHPGRSGVPSRSLDDDIPRKGSVTSGSPPEAPSGVPAWDCGEVIDLDDRKPESQE